jgi:UDP-glucose-4-epimerase GalE
VTDDVRLANPVIVSGGAGYIGSHVVCELRKSGFSPIVLDSLANGHIWATRHAAFFQHGDIADAGLVRRLCGDFRPIAALHFAAFIEVAESVADSGKYFSNNRDKAKIFFDVLAKEGVHKIVFSSTAAVYGEGRAFLTEDSPTAPINPYGESKLDAERYLRSLECLESCTLRYFNIAGAAPEAGLGEAHFPESHLIPRIVLPLIDTPGPILTALGLGKGFKIYGEDHATRDGTAIRDYIHVLDLAEAHVKALRYLLCGGQTNIFNLGSGSGYSVREVVQAAREVLNRPGFQPPVGPQRAGDPATLVAANEKAGDILGWAPRRGLAAMIKSAAHWHQSDLYRDAILEKCAPVA